MLCHFLVSLDSNIFTVVLVTVSVLSLFQLSNTLVENKLRGGPEVCCTWNLYGWPRVCVARDGFNIGSGHLLDYIITRKDSSGVSNLYVSDFICDHRALHVSLTCNRVYPERKQIDVRSLKCIKYDALEDDLIGTANIPNTPMQHGYKTQHSTVTALHTLNNTVAKGFNQMAPPARTITVALDMSKAFDTINIHTLIRKLLQTNIPGTIIKFIANYIKGRKAYTT